MDSAASKNKPRIGFLTTELGAGGAERVVFELARRLSRGRFEVAGVWCLAPATGFFAGELGRVGIPAWGAEAGTAFNLAALLRLGRELRRARLDLLNAHLFHAGVAARLLRRWARFGKLIVTHHFPENRPWRYAAERLLLRRSTPLTAVSGAVAAAVSAGLRLPTERVRVIPNGVDAGAIAARITPEGRAEARRRFRLPPEARVVGTVGRLAEQKDPLTLLEAFAQLARADPGLRLLWVGDGPLYEKVWRRAGELGLGERVCLTGFSPDAPAALAAMDVFAMSSKSEGHPLALLEAMAAGLPVAAGCIPAVEEAVGASETSAPPALLVPPGDPAALSGAIARLLAEPETARRLGAAGSERARRLYGIERMVRDYEELFAEALAPT